MLAADRYLRPTNSGLAEIRFTLNDGEFKLVTDAAEVNEESNTYLMPVSGELILDLSAFMTDNNNNMRIEYEGQPGANATALFIDSVDQVDIVLEGTPTSVETVTTVIPDELTLHQNYPNPFNPATQIQFDIPANMRPGVDVKLTVYNLLGDLIVTLTDEFRTPGQYVVEWDGKNGQGQPVSSGIYIYQISAGEIKQMKRMLLLK